MQPDIPEWIKYVGDVLVASLSGLAAATFRAGRRSAQHDQKIKTINEEKFTALREQLRSEMAEMHHAGEESRDLLVGQFNETLQGLRRQFDDHRLATEQNFVRRDDFKEFREEIRDDMREIKQMIQQIPRQ